jgi:hypothetical protein
MGSTIAQQHSRAGEKAHTGTVVHRSGLETVIRIV